MEEQLVNIINIFWDIIKNWWWVLLPFILYRPFLYFWLYWRQENWMLKQKKVLLEVKMPKEVLKPLRSMEQVFSTIWGSVYDPADWWEKWFEGKTQISVQLEMVSLGGEPHLYVRTDESRQQAIEAAIYSQYPEAEISVVSDYAKDVPQSIPNKDWDMWATDYTITKPDVYPFRTYSKFFEEKPDAPKEEKRVDPMATLLEGFGKFGPGEQLWIQITATPVTNKENNFIDRGMKIKDELAKRPGKAKEKSILGEAASELITGTMPGTSAKKEELALADVYPPEMRMTPGEKEIISGVEEKISKRCFLCSIRFIYLAKRDVYFGGGKAIPLGYFQQFATENMNQPYPWTKTITKIHRKLVFDMMRVRRLYIRKRRMFFRYVNRFSPMFPLRNPGGTFILNIEELATIFHFPGRTAAPAPFVSRVEAKKGEAPPGLPMEE